MELNLFSLSKLNLNLTIPQNSVVRIYQITMKGLINKEFLYQYSFCQKTVVSSFFRNLSNKRICTPPITNNAVFSAGVIWSERYGKTYLSERFQLSFHG